MARNPISMDRSQVFRVPAAVHFLAPPSRVHPQPETYWSAGPTVVWLVFIETWETHTHRHSIAPSMADPLGWPDTSRQSLLQFNEKQYKPLTALSWLPIICLAMKAAILLLLLSYWLTRRHASEGREWANCKNGPETTTTIRRLIFFWKKNKNSNKTIRRKPVSSGSPASGATLFQWKFFF